MVGDQDLVYLEQIDSEQADIILSRSVLSTGTTRKIRTNRTIRTIRTIRIIRTI